MMPEGLESGLNDKPLLFWYWYKSSLPLAPRTVVFLFASEFRAPLSFSPTDRSKPSIQFFQYNGEMPNGKPPVQVIYLY